jgi:hypothetical protein
MRLADTIKPHLQNATCEVLNMFIVSLNIHHIHLTIGSTTYYAAVAA